MVFYTFTCCIGGQIRKRVKLQHDLGHLDICHFLGGSGARRTNVNRMQTNVRREEKGDKCEKQTGWNSESDKWVSLQSQKKRKNFQSGKIFHTIRLLCAINVNKCSISGLPRQFLTVSGLSRKFLYFLDSIWIVWKVSRLSRQSLDCSESFWIKQTLSGLSGKFICYPDSLWIVRTAFRLYGQSLDCLENWIIHFHSF